MQDSVTYLLIYVKKMTKRNFFCKFSDKMFANSDFYCNFATANEKKAYF